MMLATTMKAAATSTIPWMTGRSSRPMALTTFWPSPGRPKMVSVMIAPPSTVARSMPNWVTIGVIAARRAWR